MRMRPRHKTNAVLLAGLTLAGLCGWGLRQTTRPAPAPLPGWYGEVLSVHDGDTIKVKHGEKTETVRLAGIDAPELKQAHGEAARDWLARECQGREVRVVGSERDRYGRTIGDLFYGKRWLNREIVDRGFAWHYTRYSANKELAAAEAEARQAKRGLWAGDDSPQPPWEWRKQQKEK